MNKRLSKMGWIILAALLCLSLIALPACTSTGEQQEEEEEEWPEILILSCHETGSSHYPAEAAVAAMATDYIEGVRVDLSPYGSPASLFPELAATQQADIGVANSVDGYNAMAGLGSFEGEPLKDHRYIIPFLPVGWFTFARADSGVETIADMAGKKWMDDFTPSTVGQTAAGAIRDAYDLEPGVDYVSVPFGGVSDVVPALTEGTADAGSYFHDGRHASYLEEMLTAIELNYVSLDDDKIPEILALAPGMSVITSAAGTFEGQDEVWKGVGFGVQVSARVGLPDDLVYEIVAAVYDHIDEYIGYAPTYEAIRLPGGLDPGTWTYPLHAGAVAYYEDNGWWTSEMADKQADLLDQFGLEK